jgi:membrane protease YdiL (CAAX protease family)
LINGQGLFPEWDATWTYTTIIYMLGVTIFILVEEKLPRKISKEGIPEAHEGSLIDNIFGFCIAFPITAIILLAIYDSGFYFQNLNQMPAYLILPTLVYQLIPVSSSEEIIFRGVIFRFLYQYHWTIAWFGSAFMFSIFHYAVYSSISAFVIAFIIGVILSWCADRWNLGVTTAIHWTWNIFILGAIITFI